MHLFIFGADAERFARDHAEIFILYTQIHKVRIRFGIGPTNAVPHAAYKRITYYRKYTPYYTACLHHGNLTTIGFTQTCLVPIHYTQRKLCV